MKKLFLFLMLGIFLISFTSAIIIQDNLVTQGFLGSSSGGLGAKFTPNQTIQIDGVTRYTGCTANKILLYYDNGTLINTGTILSGENISFSSPITLNDGIMYTIILDDSLGGSYDKYYGGATFPILNSRIEWNYGTSSPTFVNISTGLYNIKNILLFDQYEDSYISLNSPINGSVISDVGTNFTVSGNVSSVGGTWENITYYVWRNSTLVNSTALTITGSAFQQTLFIDNFSFGDYQWNARACYTNVTGDYCIFGANNNTFAVSLFTINSETYANNTVSGTLENFSISINLLEGYDLSEAHFIYNGTDETPNIISQGENRYLLISDYQIPILLADANFTFYWDMTFTGGIELNSTSRTQIVTAIALDNCSSYTNHLLNISLFDEITKVGMSGDIELIYYILNVPLYNTINTLNFQATGVSSTLVCSNINLSDENLVYSAEIRYSSDGYASELYHIQRSAITESMEQLKLYDLNSSSATQFKITYQDSTFNFVEGAIIQLQRKYISEDLYEVVEAPLTSSDGVSILHIDLNSIKYRVTVVKNGIVLDEFENLVFKCQSELTGECEMKLLGEIDSQNDINLDNTLDFYYSEPVSNNDSITVTFGVPSGSPSSINIVMEQRDQFGNKIMCNRTVVSSTGSISCDYSESLGESYIDFYIYKDGQPMALKTYIIQRSNDLDWLGNNYIFIFVILLSLVGMALSSPEWIIINGIVTMVVSGALYLANGLDFATGLGNVVWLLIAGIILISKISKQEDR